MALVSPGVEVTVIDESNYLPAATNSVPYILIATAENKVSGTGTGVAAGTTAAKCKRSLFDFKSARFGRYIWKSIFLQHHSRYSYQWLRA